MKELQAMPQNLDAERIVLANIIKRADNITEILDIIQPKDFYKEMHKFLFQNLIQMFNRDLPIELHSIISFIGKEELTKIGGIGYLTQLIGTELTYDIKHYAKILKNLSEKRSIIKTCQLALEVAYDEKSSTEGIISSIEDTFMSFSNTQKEKTVNLEELMTLTIDNIEENYKNGGDITGIRTSYNNLDKATNGMSKGDLWVIAARPSMGKTLFAMNILKGLPEKYKGVLFELEMNKAKIGNRLLASTSRMNIKKISRGQLEDKDFTKICDMSNNLVNKNNLFFNCKPKASLAYIRSECKKLKIKYGLDVIMIDHIGLMETKDKGNRSLELGELTSGLKALAKDLDCCVIFLCQLSRGVEQRQDKHPILSDLRESGRIEEDVDTAIMLYRDDYYAEREFRESNSPNTLEAFIAKNRDGEIGGLQFYCDLENQFIGEMDFIRR